MKFKYPDTWLAGMALGLLCSIAGIFLFSFFLSIGSSRADFTVLLEQAFTEGPVQKGVLKLALLANLPVFYLLLNHHKYRAGYGMLLVVLIWTAAVFFKYHL